MMNKVSMALIMAFAAAGLSLCADEPRDTPPTAGTKVIVVAPDGSTKEVEERVLVKGLVGEYICGDGLGYNLNLHLKDGGHFECIWKGCLGEYGKSAGEWVVGRQGVKLAPVTAEGNLKEKPLGHLQVVRFQRHLLLLPDRDRDWFEKNGPDRLCCLHKRAARDDLDKEQMRRLEKAVGLIKLLAEAKKHTKVLLFMNTGESLGMTQKGPIRRVLDPNGKVILGIDPANTRADGRAETEYQDSRLVQLSWWTRANRDSLKMRPQSRGTANIYLEADSGQKEFFEIIVLDSALAVLPGSTIRLQAPSKKAIKEIEVGQQEIVSAKVDQADPTRVMITGLTQGISTIRLSNAAAQESMAVVVHPEKITEDKVLILSAEKEYWLWMSRKEEISQIENSNEEVLQIRSTRDTPDSISLKTLLPGFSRLKLASKDKSTETFAVFVVKMK
jgi:hypothetical protein